MMAAETPSLVCLAELSGEHQGAFGFRACVARIVLRFDIGDAHPLLAGSTDMAFCYRRNHYPLLGGSGTLPVALDHLDLDYEYGSA